MRAMIRRLMCRIFSHVWMQEGMDLMCTLCGEERRYDGGHRIRNGVIRTGWSK